MRSTSLPPSLPPSPSRDPFTRHPLYSPSLPCNPSNPLPQARPETDFLFFEDSPGESTRRMQEGRAQRTLMNPEARAGVLCVGELRVLSGMPILN